jgi:hypothetical protein
LAAFVPGVNALAAVIPNQSLVALAFLNGASILNPPKIVQGGTPATAGFTHLINALFGSTPLALKVPVTFDAAVSDQVFQPQPQPQIQPTVQTNAASTQLVAPTTESIASKNPELPVLPALATPVTSDANVAQAMIRSMLGVTKQATISPTKLLTPKAVDSKVATAANKTTPAFVLAAVAVPLTVPFVAELVPRETAPVANAPAANPSAMNTSGNGFSQSLLKDPAVEIVTLNAAQLQSNAPIAFAAKLTPIAMQAQFAPDVAPVDDSDPATTPQPLTRNHTARLSDAAEPNEPVAPIAMAAAASSYTGGFSHSFQDTSQQNATPTIAADPKTPATFGTTFGMVGESMRASESMTITSAPAVLLSTAPVQSIAMRINPPDGHPDMPVVDLQVSSRGNEIHVAVRTSDAQLESAMRQDLGALSSSLDRAGYRTETYVPRDTVREIGREIGFTAAQPTSGSQENRESSQDQAHDQTQQNFMGRDFGGSAHGRQQQGRQNQGQSQGQNQRFRNWIFEMEKQ